MIIFGFRGMVKLLGMVTLICRRCGNPAAHRVVRRSRWFTLFFVPIFPFSISRAMTCTFCGAGTKLSKQEAEQVLGTSAPQQQPLGPSAEQIAPPAQGTIAPPARPNLTKPDPSAQAGPAPQPAPRPAPRPMPPSGQDERQGPAAS